MHAYMMTDDEAFTCFASDALGTLLARCTCEQQSQHRCDECRVVDAIGAERDLTFEEVLYEKSRAMARRMMKRRRVDVANRSRKIEELKAAHAALGYGIAPASCIPDHILHKD